MKKETTINFRTNIELKERLKEQADREHLGFSTYCNKLLQIVSKYKGNLSDLDFELNNKDASIKNLRSIIQLLKVNNVDLETLENYIISSIDKEN